MVDTMADAKVTPSRLLLFPDDVQAVLDTNIKVHTVASYAGTLDGLAVASLANTGLSDLDPSVKLDKRVVDECWRSWTQRVPRFNSPGVLYAWREWDTAWGVYVASARRLVQQQEDDENVYSTLAKALPR